MTKISLNACERKENLLFWFLHNGSVLGTSLMLSLATYNSASVFMSIFTQHKINTGVNLGSSDIFRVCIQPWACEWHARFPGIHGSPSKPLFLQEHLSQPPPFHVFTFNHYLFCLSPLLQEASGGICFFLLPKLLLRKLLWLKGALKKRSTSTLASQGPPD